MFHVQIIQQWISFQASVSSREKFWLRDFGITNVGKFQFKTKAEILCTWVI